jgi:hypothetical protein
LAALATALLSAPASAPAVAVATAPGANYIETNFISVELTCEYM